MIFRSSLLRMTMGPKSFQCFLPLVGFLFRYIRNQRRVRLSEACTLLLAQQRSNHLSKLLREVRARLFPLTPRITRKSLTSFLVLFYNIFPHGFSDRAYAKCHHNCIPVDGGCSLSCSATPKCFQKSVSRTQCQATSEKGARGAQARVSEIRRPRSWCIGEGRV